MKKFIISGPKKNHTVEYFYFPDIKSSIKYVIDNEFYFVDFNILSSKQVYIYQQLDDGDYYIVAIVNPLTEEVQYQSI